MRYSLAILLALAACGGNKAKAPEAAAPAAPGAAVDQSFRNTQPTAGPVPELVAPVVVKKVLGNGLTVLVVSKRDLPLVNATVYLKTGSAADPSGLPGVAGFTADMLRSGTATRSAEQLADEIETRGATLDVGADEDMTSVSATAMAENFPTVFDVIADVVQRSNFAPVEVERVRKRRLTSIAETMDDPESTASLAFTRAVYGTHPYGHDILGDVDAVKKIQKKDLETFFAKHYRPANAAVVLVGDMPPDQAFAEVEKRFGGWKGAAGVDPAPAAPKALAPALLFVDRPGAPQSQLRIGQLGVERSHPDYFPLVLMNAILGGMFNSRINMNLREDKGYTYGARSAFDFDRAPGTFAVATGVRTDATGPAITEVLKEIDHMRTSNVSDEELEHAKNSYSLSLPGYFQSVGRIASMTGNLWLFDLPLDYYQQLPDKLRAVTVADVRRVAEKHLTPAELSIIVVGNKTTVIDALSALKRGDVEEVTPEGKPVAASTPKAKSAR